MNITVDDLTPYLLDDLLDYFVIYGQLPSSVCWSYSHDLYSSTQTSEEIVRVYKSSSCEHDFIKVVVPLYLYHQAEELRKTRQEFKDRVYHYMKGYNSDKSN